SEVEFLCGCQRSMTLINMVCLHHHCTRRTICVGLLSGKTAIVTGAGRGIGGAIARGLGREGANVVLVSRTRSQLEEQAEIIEGYGVETLVVTGDVASEADVKNVVKEAVSRF